MDFATTIRNIRGADLEFGSPTTQGRERAGYTGLFLRMPRAWTGGRVLSPARAPDGADELMGREAPWAAFSGQHDDIDGGATVIAYAGTTSGPRPIEWFVRSEPFPVLAPSPAFHEAFTLADGEEIRLTHRHVFLDRIWDDGRAHGARRGARAMTAAPLFPGGVAVSDLAVYDWEAADGRCGGSPHLHTASSEGYVVTAGSGAVHTISRDGAAVHPLAAGSACGSRPAPCIASSTTATCDSLVIMQNSGLPEAGDAVLTFPARVLDDPDAYARAATLPRRGEAAADEIAAAARARRDLAMEGYLELQEAMREREARKRGTSCSPAPRGSCSRRSRSGSDRGTRPSPPRPSAPGRSSPRSPSGDPGALAAASVAHQRAGRPASAGSACAGDSDVGLARRGWIALSSETF